MPPVVVIFLIVLKPLTHKIATKNWLTGEPTIRTAIPPGAEGRYGRVRCCSDAKHSSHGPGQEENEVTRAAVVEYVGQ